MKPKEFDELVRQKFEQNDFAYNPGNWERLAEQMDGKEKKRSLIMWWWAPVVGMAASVALAMGVTTTLRMQAPAGNGTGNGIAKVYRTLPEAPVAEVSLPAQQEPVEPLVAQSVSTVNNVNSSNNNRNNHIAAATTASNNNWMGIKLNDANSGTATIHAIEHKITAQAEPQPMQLAANDSKKAAQKPKKVELVLTHGYNTFNVEEEQVAKKPASFSIILSGGINHGSQGNGYAAGATVRKMINDNVFIESDVAFASSDNVQKTQYLASSESATPPPAGTAAKPGYAAKSAAVEANKTTTVYTQQGTMKTQDVSYSLYYAQVSPSIGVKVMKRMSIGAGPDFQKALADNRPATSVVDRGNLQIAPLFDVGFIGKTEYALSKTVRAGISYRKGINNIITPTDKYIDRDYLQFQVKCAIFNK